MTLRFILTSFTALALTTMSLPAYAAVTNTVTAKGTAPGGAAGAITSTATANVDMEDSAPAIEVVRSWSFAPGGDANNNGLVDAGDQIVYSYAVHNSGNTTLADVNVNDIHDGTGASLIFVTPVSVTTDNGSIPAGTKNDSTDAGTGDGDWDRLGPNDFITFTSQPYTVTPGDFASVTSADADIDGTVTVSGTNSSGVGSPTVSGTSAAPVPLNVIPSLEVTKVASLDTNVPAGTPITYTYHVKNNGTVPINNVTLHDTHKGVLDALVPTFSSWAVVTTSTVSGNTINTLAPGDEAIFTATYTVTQSDVDTLQ
jgi:large repetitive protein